MEKLPQEKQLALSQYANEQNWFELGVDGSIIAKAWDYIDLRLPNAYSQYFDIALSNGTLAQQNLKPLWIIVSPKPSPWPLLAKKALESNGNNLPPNARGLMQLLPSTAQNGRKSATSL